MTGPRGPQTTEAPLWRVQGFRVALEDGPSGVIATCVDVQHVWAIAPTRSEALERVRQQLAPFWKRSPLDGVVAAEDPHG